VKVSDRGLKGYYYSAEGVVEWVGATPPTTTTPKNDRKCTVRRWDDGTLEMHWEGGRVEVGREGQEEVRVVRRGQESEDEEEEEEQDEEEEEEDDEEEDEEEAVNN